MYAFKSLKDFIKRKYPTREDEKEFAFRYDGEKFDNLLTHSFGFPFVKASEVQKSCGERHVFHYLLVYDESESPFDRYIRVEQGQWLVFDSDLTEFLRIEAKDKEE